MKQATPANPLASESRRPVAHLYARISHPDQRKGGGLGRQTEEAEHAAAEFGQQHGFDISKKIWVDDGVSAFKGVHRSPEHQLGQFLAQVRRGLIPKGDCLLIENWDRLSRQDIWAATGLVSELRQLQIHVGRLDRMKLLRHDSDDVGDFFEAAVELMRGHSESAAKSVRNGAAWQRKRKAARDSGKVITHRLPAWVEERDGKLVLIPDRVALVKRIFHLSASGYGAALIVKQLTTEKVPAFGVSGHWSRAYIGLILKDRRVLGEFQPRRLDGSPEGDPIANYLPAAVTEEEFYAARARASGRRQKAGRVGDRIELFSGLLKNARGGGSYYVATRTDGGKHTRVLLNIDGAEGRAPCLSFPLMTFEAAILSRLKELDPHEILNGDREPDDTLTLAGQLEQVEGRIAALEAELLHGDVASIARVLRQLEERRKELASELAAAREKAAHPLSESWGETKTLLEAMDAAPDRKEARLRLRSALRRIVENVWLLIVPRGRDRLCAVQIFFAGSACCRSYLIFHRPPKANKSARQEGRWWCRSLAGDLIPDNLDLRRPEDAQLLEAALAAVDLSADRMAG